jgi:hypothetical protein
VKEGRAQKSCMGYETLQERKDDGWSKRKCRKRTQRGDRSRNLQIRSLTRYHCASQAWLCCLNGITEYKGSCESCRCITLRCSVWCPNFEVLEDFFLSETANFSKFEWIVT